VHLRGGHEAGLVRVLVDEPGPHRTARSGRRRVERCEDKADPSPDEAGAADHVAGGRLAQEAAPGADGVAGDVQAGVDDHGSPILPDPFTRASRLVNNFNLKLVILKYFTMRDTILRDVKFELARDEQGRLYNAGMRKLVGDLKFDTSAVE